MESKIKMIKENLRQAQLNYGHNMTKIEDILLWERSYISREPIDEDVVVLCSGGLDSSVMIERIIEEFNVKIHALFIKRGAKAEELEEKAFDFFMDYYKKKFPDNMKGFEKIKFSIPPGYFKDNFPKELALTIGHPLRNSTMQNLAVMYAVSLNGKHDLNIRTILTGSVAEDQTEPELGLLSLRSQTLSTCIQLGDWDWQITSPLTDINLREYPLFKVNLIQYAVERGIPLEKTRTCFSADEVADGTCLACYKRLIAFEKAEVKDPVKYKGKTNGD